MMQNVQLEIFSRLFFLNLTKNLANNDLNILPGQQSPTAGASSQSSSQLEPPTPPRTPVALLAANTPRSTEKIYNNNNDDAKENFEENSGRRSNSSTPIKLLPNVTLTPTSKLLHHHEQESEGEDYSRRNYNEDSNLSDEDNGSSRLGRHSVVSGHNGGDDSEHESDLYGENSYDGSKLSLKNVENLLDKTSPMVSFLLKIVKKN